MASLSSCLSKFGKAIPEGDVADIRAKQQTLMADGVPAEAAAVQAIEAVILEAEADLQTVAEAAKAKGVELTVGRRKPGEAGPTPAKPQGVLFKRKGSPAEAADAAKVAEAAREMASPKPAPKPKTFGGTVEEVKRKAMASWGPLIVRLQKAGILNFITTEEARKIDRGIPANPTEGNRVPGFYVNGKAYIVVDQIRQDEVAGVVLHEVGEHYGLRKMVGDELYDRTLALVGRRAGSDPDVKDGMRKAVEAGTSPEHMLQETLAHLIEAKPGHDLATRIIDGIKLWFNRRGKDAFNESEVELLRRMARESLRASARAAPRGDSKKAILFHRAWHGTPHTWKDDRADMSKVGTGEGAQAYGHGLYFAGKRAVAEFYRNNLTGSGANVTLDGKPVTLQSIEPMRGSDPAAYDALSFAIMSGGEFDVGIETTAASLRNDDNDAAADWLEANADRVTISKNDGRLYEVELAPDESDYLDWDKPLSEQSEKVRGAIASVPKVRNTSGQDMREMDPTGGEIYRALTRSYGDQKQVSDALHAAGIPGIRYRDGSSRGKDGDGSHNYVIFDDKLVEVKAKYSKRGEPPKQPQQPSPRKELRQNEREWTANLPRKSQQKAPLFSRRGDANFEQPEDYDFKEADYRKPVVSWAKERLDFTAPNGKPAWQNFVRWFGDSQVVDADGEPLVVYHGTHAVFDSFNTGAGSMTRSGNNVAGAFFTPDPRKASLFAKGEGGHVGAFYLNIKNPAPDSAIVAATYGSRGRGAAKSPEAVQKSLIEQGYDGAYRDGNWIAFYPTQAKSAIGNTGDFSAKNDIRFSRRGAPDSPQFRLWFGASKVVDKDGNPLVVYHGTASEFWTFEKEKISSATNHSTSPLGFFFTPDRAKAEHYARNASEGVPADERIVDVYLSIQNPYTMSAEEAEAIEDQDEARALVKKLRAQGYDGIRMTSRASDSWIAFESTQAKSASQNNGDYSRTNPDIRRSARATDPAAIANGTAPQPISMLETITRLRDSGMSEEAIDAMDYEELVEARRQFSEPPVDPPNEDDGDEPGRDGDGENLTSAKNAVTDAEREAEGRDPILRDAIRANEGVVNGALQTLAVNPAAAEEVMERLAMTDHRGTVDDEAILLVEKVKQRRMRDAAGARASDAKATPEARAVARREWDVIEETLNRIDHALSSIGTEAGRLLQFRTRMIAEDFSLEAMERKERVLVGRPLTQDEAAKVKREWEAIAKRQKALDEAEKALDEAKIAAGVERTYKGMLEELQAAMGRPRKRGEKLLDTLRARAEASRAALAKMAEVENVKSGKQSGAVINPVAFVHLANIGAFHVANGAVKFADWLAKIKAEIGAKLFGEVEDSMPAVFDAAKAQHAAWEATDEAEPPRKAKAKPRQRGERAARPAKDADPSTPESVLEGIDPAKITHQDVYELAQAHVLAGLRGENEVMAAVHADLETIAPDLTERDVRRLFSDYGNVKFPSQDEDKRVLRELRVLVQLQESIDRMTEGLQAMKSGPQRDKATKEIREKRRRLNDLLKRSIAQRGHSPERMATFQEARKTNLRNQIEDLNEQLRTGVKPVRPGAPPPDAEVLRMREVRDALRVQLKALETPQEKADRANAARATALRNQLTALENQLRTGVKPTRAEGPPADATVTALRGRIAALRAAIKAMEPEAEADARFQQARAKALRTEMEKVKARIAKGDYARYPRREPRALTKANEIAAFELAKVKNEFRRRQFEQEMAARPKWRKVVGGIAEVGNLTRALMTSLDVSAIGRQGWFIAAGHPIMAAKSIIPMFKAFFSPKAQFAIDEAITKRDNFALYKKHGLELTEHNNHLPTKMEEAFMSRWLDYVQPDPAAGFTKKAILEFRNKLLSPVRGSQRAYTTFLNLLRADAFDAMAATLGKNDVLSKAEGDAIANYINVATGRGKIGKKNAGAQFLSNIFFAPRLVASRFNLLFGQPLYGGSARSKALIAAEYARFLAGTAVVYMLGALAKSGEDDDDDRPFVESDPRSRNFGKMRFGNTYVDPLAGLAQTTTFATQMITGEKKTAGKQEVQPLARYGRLSDVTGDQYGKKTPFWDDIAGVMTYFARTKLAPLPSALIDARTGYDVIGRETSPVQEAKELIVPMSLRDVVKLTEQHGIPRGLAFTLANMFGFGVQARDDADFNKPQK